MGMSAKHYMGLGMATILALSAASQAGITITDQFDLSENSADARYAGNGLNGTTTMAGGSVWSANAAIKFAGAGSGGYIGTGAGSLAAKIAAAPTVNDPILTVQASLLHAFDANGKGADGTSGAWLAIGLGSSSATNDNTYAGGVFVLLHSGGQVSLLTNNGSLATLASKSSINMTQAHTVKLVYNKTTNSAQAFIDDVAIGVGTYNLAFTPTVNAVGFSSYNAKVGGSIDNFSVTTIPEPTAVGLLGLGGLLLAKRAR